MSSRLDRIRDWEKFTRQCGYRARRLAEWAQSSERQLRRYFRRRFKLGLKGWLQALRMQEAERLIRAGQPIKTIWQQLDYASYSAFAHAFTRTHNGCPRQFQAWLLTLEGPVKLEETLRMPVKLRMVSAKHAGLPRVRSVKPGK